MRVLFLGTGTSHGVPMIGCECDVCRSSDPRDSRSRPSIALDFADGLRLLVDTTPDLRHQALRFGLRHVDAVLFTHPHADHIMGLDDVRRYNMMTRQPMPLFGSAATLAEIRQTFRYAFGEVRQAGGGIPRLDLWPVAGPFCIGRHEVVPVPIMHGGWPILGYRVGRFAYLTDCSDVPETSLPLLAGLDVLVLDALRHKPHPTHFTVEQAVAMATRIGARQTWFTHIAHDLGHAATDRTLPAGMALAYDGLSFDVE